MGLVGCFLPMHYDHDGPGAWSWWDMRHDMPVVVYAVLAAYALAALVALTSRRITRGRAVVSAAAFGVVAAVLWPPVPVFVLSGWYLMVLGAFGGCATSIAALFAGSPEPGEQL